MVDDWREPVATSAKHAVVVVAGDVGRSPRMQYHALSLAEHGYAVTLVGYAGELCCEAVVAEGRIREVRVGAVELPAWLPGLVARALKLLLLVARLGLAVRAARRGRRAAVVLCQTPPAIPSLAVCWFWARVDGARVVGDWHNLGFSVVEDGARRARRGALRGSDRLAVAAYRALERRSAALLDGQGVAVLPGPPPRLEHRTALSSLHELMRGMRGRLEERQGDLNPGRDAAVELANVAGKPRPSESTEMVAVRALLESNLKAKRFREARRYLGILESMEEDARRREAKRLEDAANAVRDRAARDATGAERASAARMETRYAELRVRRRGALGDERRARRTRALRVEYRASVAAREGPAPLPPSPVKRRAALAPFRGAAPGGRGDTRVCGRHDFDTAADGTVSFDAWSKTFAPKRRFRAPACDDAPAAERPRSSDPLGASFWITTGHLSHGEDTAAGALSPRGPLYGQRLADLRF